MTPYVSDPDFQLYVGDALEVLRELPDESVHTCCTSPPYWGLRDYGTEGQIGLEPTPEAFVAAMVAVFREVRRVLRSDGTLWLNLGDSYASTPTKQVVDGIRAPQTRRAGHDDASGFQVHLQGTAVRPGCPPGYKPKDLVGIPWLTALALRADGWYLRSDIVWSKPNPMPESVTDRPTKSHEYVFLLTKGPRYFFDQEAVREPAEWSRWGDQTNAKHEGSGSAAGWITSKTKAELQRPQARRAMELFDQAGLTEEHARAIRAVGITDTGKATVTQSGTGKSDPRLIALAQEAKDALGGYYREFLVPNGRNLRSVWEIATQPYPQAHFATFPEALPERCIKAGTSERGCCPECGAPWEREVERGIDESRPLARQHIREPEVTKNGQGTNARGSATWGHYLTSTTTGWRPGCNCTFRDPAFPNERPERYTQVPVPCTVLDPFMGSGTTALVARKLGRRSVGIELNPEYARLAADRLKQLSLFAEQPA